MQNYEYKVVPAPTRGLKARGLKKPEARFANALQAAMNTLAAEGWEYQRAETLPSEERTGLASHTTHYRNVLVFRRAVPTKETTPHAPTAPVSEGARDAASKHKAAPSTGGSPDTAKPALGSDAQTKTAAPNTATVTADLEPQKPKVKALRPEDALAEEALAKAGLIQDKSAP